jgi:AcrR family transcriptional regulator
MAGESTRERILTAAERLFAERGITSTSMRALTRAAGVNLAAAHYHFGSKEALLDAVIERRSLPLNRERIRELERHEAERDDAAPEIESIFRAFLLPTVRDLTKSPQENSHLPRLFARVEAQPPELLEALYRKHLGGVARRFVEALQRALPELPKEVVADRFRLAMGSIFSLFSGNCDLDFIPDHTPQVLAVEQKLEQVIAFVSGGMHAPHAARRAPGPRPRRTPGDR